jgi:hypothetical protein
VDTVSHPWAKVSPLDANLGPACLRNGVQFDANQCPASMRTHIRSMVMDTVPREDEKVLVHPKTDPVRGCQS